MVDYRNDPVVQLSPGKTAYLVTQPNQDGSVTVKSGYVEKKDYSGEVWAQPTGVVGGWSPSTPLPVVVNAQSAQSMRDQQLAIQRQRQQNNMVLGFIPNPAARYDKPISGFLENLPTRKAFAKEGQQGLTAVQELKPAFLKRVDESPVSIGIMGGVNAYREDIQTRPTKFLLELGIGYGLGKVAIAGSGWLSGLAAAGKISQRTATLTPKAIKYGLAGGYAAVTGINVALAPTPKEKGEVVGRSLSELTGLSLGAGLAYRTTPIRPGMTTEQVVRQKENVPTLDVRETFDLSKASAPEQYGVPKNPRPVTKAERAMLIDQYGLSPSEVTLARKQGLSVRDVLNIRSRMEVPPIYEPEVTVKPPRVENIININPKIEAPARVRMMYGFVPDIFTTEINLAKRKQDAVVFPGTLIDVAVRQGAKLDVLEGIALDTGVRTDQMIRTDQIVREETLITNIIETSSLFTGGLTGLTSSYRPPGPKTTFDVPKIPPVFVPPIIPWGGGGGSGYPGRSRWGYTFTEELKGGDPLSDIFGIMTGLKGLGPRKRRGKKK